MHKKNNEDENYQQFKLLEYYVENCCKFNIKIEDLTNQTK